MKLRRFLSTLFYNNPRLIMVVIVAAVAVGMWLWDWSCTQDFKWLNYAAGLFTELAGIAFTIFLIDYLADLARKRIDVEALTWELLYELDYAVWAWLGGIRAYDYKELRTLIDSIEANGDKPSCHITSLLQELGNKAAAAIRTKKEQIKINENVHRGLNELKNLGMIRSRSEELVNEEIQKILHNTLYHFTQVSPETKKGDESIDVVKKRSSYAWQEWRCTGKKNQSEMDEDKGTVLSIINNDLLLLPHKHTNYS